MGDQNQLVPKFRFGAIFFYYTTDNGSVVIAAEFTAQSF